MDTIKSTGWEDNTRSSCDGEKPGRICEQEVVQTSLALQPTDLYLNQAVPKREANPPRLLCPWMGIVVNIIDNPKTNNSRAQSAAKAAAIKEKFKEYNPERVFMFRDCNGQQSTALLVFKDGFQGLEDALAFQETFVEGGRGRKEWWDEDRPANVTLYGWQATEKDLTINMGKMTEHLKKSCHLKTWDSQFTALKDRIDMVDPLTSKAKKKVEKVAQELDRGRDKMELNLLLRVYPLQERLEMLEHCCAVWR
ncbi:hypothetical protein KC19_9G120900 [Ceratodon purpureus]|uniref:XS domain-containing protein n=1 Tax=Ceratodon purpureus TaxID=3225 RepID=A0A8T0GT18_CERPU|nr:hypothetical protein KC19_9G120900 [Ceratodon purpureus]KAG0562140.1 hypothetical protein KC19_9G120900 [Ceratodon purpureus]KAG0562141.1 hypothetical protein KC19_9G120900 [Ceratodon purpureus]